MEVIPSGWNVKSKSGGHLLREGAGVVPRLRSGLEGLRRQAPAPTGFVLEHVEHCLHRSAKGGLVPASRMTRELQGPDLDALPSKANGRKGVGLGTRLDDQESGRGPNAAMAAEARPGAGAPGGRNEEALAMQRQPMGGRQEPEDARSKRYLKTKVFPKCVQSSSESRSLGRVFCRPFGGTNCSDPFWDALRKRKPSEPLLGHFWDSSARRPSLQRRRPPRARSARHATAAVASSLRGTISSAASWPARSTRSATSASHAGTENTRRPGVSRSLGERRE